MQLRYDRLQHNSPEMMFHVKQRLDPSTPSPEDPLVTPPAPGQHPEVLAELIEWLAPAAHRAGLTKYRTPADMKQHLVDPALLLLTPPLRPFLHSPALDFGAGSGAVGLAIAAAAPDVEVVLADRRARVVQFVDLAIQRFRLQNCHTLLTDLAAPAEDHWQAFGSVLIRAYGPGPVALEQAMRWLRPGGTIALWRRPEAPATPDGLISLRTEPTSLPSLVLSIYQRS